MFDVVRNACSSPQGGAKPRDYQKTSSRSQTCARTEDSGVRWHGFGSHHHALVHHLLPDPGPGHLILHVDHPQGCHQKTVIVQSKKYKDKWKIYLKNFIYSSNKEDDIIWARREVVGAGEESSLVDVSLLGAIAASWSLWASEKLSHIISNV